MPNAPKLRRTPCRTGSSASWRVAAALAWMPMHSAEQWSTATNTAAWPSPVATAVMSLAIVAQTVCGWLSGGKGFGRVRHLVGRGHVYGVEDAAPWLRALMKSAGGRVQINGTRSKARRSELGVPNAVSPSVAITSRRASPSRGRDVPRLFRSGRSGPIAVSGLDERPDDQEPLSPKSLSQETVLRGSCNICVAGAHSKLGCHISSILSGRQEIERWRIRSWTFVIS